MPGLQGLGGPHRAEVMNDDSLLGMRYSLGPVPCNFSEGFAVRATFRQSSPRRVLFLGRTSIRVARRYVCATTYDAQLSSQRENARHRLLHSSDDGSRGVVNPLRRTFDDGSQVVQARLLRRLKRLVSSVLVVEVQYVGSRGTYCD